MIYQDAAENRRKERKLRSEIDFDQLYSYANAAQASTKCQDEHRIAFFDEELLEEQLWERKVDDFVAKPIEMKEICNCIRKWLPRELIVKIRNKELNRIAAGIQKAAELKADIRQGEKLKWKGIDKLAGIKASGSEKLWKSLLGDCGNAGDLETIERETPELLQQYRSFKEVLKEEAMSLAQEMISLLKEEG